MTNAQPDNGQRGMVERLVNRAMYARSVSDGMDEIDKTLREARAADERMREATDVIEGLLRHRTTVADCQCIHHEAARNLLAALRKEEK